MTKNEPWKMPTAIATNDHSLEHSSLRKSMWPNMGDLMITLSREADAKESSTWWRVLAVRNFILGTEYNVLRAVSITGAHLARYLPNMRRVLSLIAICIDTGAGCRRHWRRAAAVERSRWRTEEQAQSCIQELTTPGADWITLCFVSFIVQVS